MIHVQLRPTTMQLYVKSNTLSMSNDFIILINSARIIRKILVLTTTTIEMLYITKEKLFGVSLWILFMLCTSITNAIPEDIGINDRMEVIENLLRKQAMQLKEQNLKVRNLENTVRIQQDKIGELESKLSTVIEEQRESAIEISTLKEIVMRLTAGNAEPDYVKGGNVTKLKEISPKKISKQESFLEKGIYINTFKIL